MSEVGETQHEADRVEDVTLARAVQSRDRIELWIPALDLGAGRIGLEAVEDNLFDVHVAEEGVRPRFPALFLFTKMCDRTSFIILLGSMGSSCLV
jgi:hypothetical protein